MESENRFVSFILELRKTALYLLACLTGGTIGFYFISPALLKIIQGHLSQKLSFFSVTEPFLAHVKIAFFMTAFFLMPIFVFALWKALAKPFGLTVKNRIWFAFFTCALFYAGVSFCSFVTLPFGIKFLLGFQSEQLKPIISVGKFVTFITMFVLAFGLIFELPVFMVFGAKAGVCPRKTFEKNRRYALLVISIVAALLTPTPDIVNMLLMGVPLYMLYELGIIVLKVLKI